MLKANSKIILILFFIVSLIFVFSGCGIQTTPPIINGTVCGYAALPDNSKDLTGYTPISGATVTIVDAEGITHTVLTDENGYYSFDNLNININTVITITKETEEGIQIFKDVVPLAVPSEENYDAGIADALSTGLALVVEGMVQAGETQEEIDLEEIANHILFDDLGEYVQQAQNNNQDLTETTITTTVYKIINNIINPPSSTPPASNNANLSKLTVSVGTLDPVFSSDVVEYAVTVDNNISSITCTPTKAESHATIKVNANQVESGKPSPEISLNPGPNTVTIVVTAEDGTTKNYTITVHRTLAITASAGSNGTIDPSGTVQVKYGTDKAFTVTAATNYHIAQIKVDGSPIDLTKQKTRIAVPTNAPKTYTYPYLIKIIFTNVTTNHTIEATFTIDTYTLTMSKTGSGTGTTTPTTGIHTYNYGASVTISASPDSSSTFTGWSGDATGTSDVELSITTNKSVTATFAIKTYTITASAGSNGSISPSGATTVNHGSNQTFYITSNSGYVIEDVRVDGSLLGVSVGAVSSYIFNNVTDNHTISVTFKPGVTGKVSDAVTGDGISGAVVIVTLGSGVVFTTTSPQGNYSFFSDIPAGTYNIKATATGYIDNTISVTIVENQPTVVDFALSETLEAGQMRIILTWGPTGDLDSYLWNPSGEKLYYGDKSITGAILDKDDSGGCGPETVTITALSDGTYTFAVHAFSLGGVSTFSDTGAVVKLYDSTGLLNTFNIPSGSSTDRWWNVFTLSVSGSGGSVTVNTINTFSSSAPLP